MCEVACEPAHLPENWGYIVREGGGGGRGRENDFLFLSLSLSLSPPSSLIPNFGEVGTVGKISDCQPRVPRPGRGLNFG